MRQTSADPVGAMLDDLLYEATVRRRLPMDARGGFADGYAEGIRFAVGDMKFALREAGVIKPVVRSKALRVTGAPSERRALERRDRTGQPQDSPVRGPQA